MDVDSDSDCLEFPVISFVFSMPASPAGLLELHGIDSAAPLPTGSQCPRRLSLWQDKSRFQGWSDTCK
ncbi:hypothetical protein Y1Q_0011933 [Alligator mississippiensis]|uniref:Uncharacterized protein n=1 Tax=Alligator mississippiensis TaxID=8496 RepID=A0A151NCF1_ALLMI|nr:hypothetical protein Y1Q_0011933 [Alligator mississippiensis]